MYQHPGQQDLPLYTDCPPASLCPLPPYESSFDPPDPVTSLQAADAQSALCWADITAVAGSLMAGSSSAALAEWCAGAILMEEQVKTRHSSWKSSHGNN